MRRFVADFETTTDEHDCRVWATGITEIGNGFGFTFGNDIEYLFKFMRTNIGSIFYFHNLKFDGTFIMPYLIKNGYKHITEKKYATPKTFTTLISDMGQFYSIEIYFTKKKKVTIYDSTKILPLKVSDVPKAFGLKESKLSIDYKEYRKPGHKLTNAEIDYLRADCDIVAKALYEMFKLGMDKMTIGSCALTEYKKLVGSKKFDKIFPYVGFDMDKQIRATYKGGFTYVNPEFKGKDMGEGISLDVNSLYPAVMYSCDLPFGLPVKFEGEYDHDELYPLFTQTFSCQFTVKDDYIPTLQIKNNLAFMPNAYVETSGDEEIELSLTSVDFKLFMEHYDVFNIDFKGGYKFKSTNTMFRDYIDKWMDVKIKATIEDNEGLRTIAKLMLNSLYGKFALNPVVQSKIPYLKDGAIAYRLGEQEVRKGIYIAVGSFITSYARQITITAAQSVKDRFMYADTDSLKLIGLDEPTNLEIDKSKLGAWKNEGSFDRARFVRQKTYITEKDCELHVTCAGLPEQSHEFVTWDNFHEGAIYGGKLMPKNVENGVVLLEKEFTIKA